mgnify:CR=1 FL=1|jgi:predicted nuclease with TOPRIM domain
MKKIANTTIVSFGAVALLLGGAGVGYTASNWQGHANMMQTESNLDELATQLSKDKTALTSKQQALQQYKNDQADLQKKLAEAESEEKTLKDQHTKDQADIQKKIQEKIDGIRDQAQRDNDRVNEKQKQVDDLEKKVSDLSSQLAKQKPSDSDTAQAIQDAQDLRDKSDRLVNQYVEK